MSHEVSINLNTRVVSKKDMEIEIKTDDGKLGTLLISKGNIEWLPAGNSVHKYRMNWKAFAALMADEGKKVRKK